MSKPTYEQAVVDVSDMCKTPDFREKFREYFGTKTYGLRSTSIEEAPEDLKFHFIYKNNVGAEKYTVTAIKSGRTYAEEKPAISYIVHPINLKYEGCYL